MNTGRGNQLPSVGALSGLQDMGFLEAAFDAVVVSDPQERITYWNPAAEQMFGWAAPEALGKTSAELFWPLSTASEKKRHRQRRSSLQQGAMLRGEYHPCRKDGSFLWVQYTAQAIFDPEGKATGYLILFRDISVQMQLREKDEQLKQSNQKLNDILESIQDDFYVLDRDWKFVYASRSFTSKIGKEPADFIGRNIWKMFPKHIGTTFEENLRATMEKGEIRSFEIPGKYTNAWYRMKTFPSTEGITVLGTDISERRQAEQALQDAVHFSSKVMESALNGLYIYDILLGKNIYINSMYERLIGYSWDDLNRLSSEQFFEFFHPEDRRAISEHMEQLQRAQDGETISVEYRFRKRNGEWAWYLSRDTVFERDPDGNVCQFIGSFLDITEQKRAEAVIRESEERFRTMANNLPFLIWVTNAQGEIEMVNRTYEEFFGVKEEQVMPPGSWQPLVHPDDREAYVSAYLKSIEKHTPFFAETRVKRADGEWRWIASQGTPRFTLNGEFLGHVGSSPDISERKQAEEAIRQSEDRLRFALRTSNTGMWDWDEKTRTGYVTAENQRMFGLSHDQVKARAEDYNRLIHPEDLERVRRAWKTAQDGEAYEIEYRIRRANDGAERWIQSVGEIRAGNDGRAHFIGLSRDITERKRWEELSRALNAVNDSIHSTLDLNEVMQRAMNQAARVLSCDTAAISLRENNRWVVKYVYSFPQDIIGMQMNDEEERHAVLAVQTKLPVAVNDAFHDERFDRDHFQKWGIRSVLVVPLITHDEAKGVIFFNYQQSPNIFANYQIDFAVKLSASLALALENVRLLGDLRIELAERRRAEEALRASEQELQLLNQSLEQKVLQKTAQVRGLASDLVKVEQRERSRISQILHDDLQQRIYALQMGLMGLRDALQVENETARQEMSNIETQMEEIRQGIRHLSIELSPPILQEEDLSQAIRWLAVQMRQQYRLPIEIHADGTFAVADQQLHVLLFNCVRELLFNIVKHARASQAMVTLQWPHSGLQIEVRDDGQGFPVMPQRRDSKEEEFPETFGLPTIRHQLSLFGGRMEIQSEPGAGTRVVLSIPVKDSID